MDTENKENITLKKPVPKVMKTYAEDMAQVIGNNKDGLIKKILHEEDKHSLEQKNQSPESKKNKFFINAGTILIIVTVLILLITFFKKEIGPVAIEEMFTPIIFSDKSIFVEIEGLSKDKIVEAVYNVVDITTQRTGEVQGIYLTENKKVIGFKRFLDLTGSNFVLPIAEIEGVDIVSDNFLLGVVNKDFFILMKMRSVPDIFDNMRAWEEKMFSDLHGFFKINLSSETQYLLTKNFENGVMGNKNARILYKKSYGEPAEMAIAYVFADDTSIVITSSPSATREVILRLTYSKIEK